MKPSIQQVLALTVFGMVYQVGLQHAVPGVHLVTTVGAQVLMRTNVLPLVAPPLFNYKSCRLKMNNFFLLAQLSSNSFIQDFLQSIPLSWSIRHLKTLFW